MAHFRVLPRLVLFFIGVVALASSIVLFFMSPSRQDWLRIYLPEILAVSLLSAVVVSLLLRRQTP